MLFLNIFTGRFHLAIVQVPSGGDLGKREVMRHCSNLCNPCKGQAELTAQGLLSDFSLVGARHPNGVQGEVTAPVPRLTGNNASQLHSSRRYPHQGIRGRVAQYHSSNTMPEWHGLAPTTYNSSLHNTALDYAP